MRLPSGYPCLKLSSWSRTAPCVEDCPPQGSVATDLGGRSASLSKASVAQLSLWAPLSAKKKWREQARAVDSAKPLDLKVRD